MKQKSNSFVLLAVVVGFVACSFVANHVYNLKKALAPHQAKAPTQFYAGMDKFLSNISWMTLIQWHANVMEGMTPERAEQLYRKLNALTNLDPLMTPAYTDGALTIAAVKPELAIQLLDKAILMGLDRDYNVPVCAGQIKLMMKQPKEAVRYFEMAAKSPDAPDFIATSRLCALCQAVDEDPVASTKVWHEYFTSLNGDQDRERKIAAARIRDYIETGNTTLEERLKTASDDAAKKSIADDQAYLKKIGEEMDKRMPAPKAPPATQPVAAVN